MLVVGPEHWVPARRCAATGMTAVVGGESFGGERLPLLSALITRPLPSSPGLSG